MKRICRKSSLVWALGGFALFAWGTGAYAASISVNFCIGLNTDATSVDAGETASQLQSVAGANWNNVLLRSSGTAGSPTNFITNSTGGKFIALRDDLGHTNAAQLTSSIPSNGAMSNTSNVTPEPNLSNMGEAGLMQTYLLIGGNVPSETFTVSGLDNTFTASGYKVYLFFDIGTIVVPARTLGYSISDGSISNVCWAIDSAGDNSDSNDDGVMEWLRATGLDQASATAGANYALLEGFSGSSFMVTVIGASRGSISGLQIVANTGTPPSIASFTATPGTIAPGQTVTLAWQVDGADTVDIAPGIGAVSASGTTNVAPSANTAYTLTASNASGAATKTAAVTIDKGPVDVYLLGGQSNMAGLADTNGIPSGQETVDGILYYYSSVLYGPSASNVLHTNVTPAGYAAGMFGPEIGFANRIKQLRPGATLALIKYAVGGSSLYLNWKPGANATDTANWGPQFSGFVSTVNSGLAALRSAGYQPRIVGMLWQQGEADSKTSTTAMLYESNLVHFISRVREQFAADIAPEGMRFVAGTVLPYAGSFVVATYPDRQTVNTALLDVDENSGSPVAVSNASTVYCDDQTTPTNAQILDGYRDTDEIHLAAEGQLMLGKLMAERMQATNYPNWSAANNLSNGPTGDDDGDGLSNALEFFLGTDAKSPDGKSVAPTASIMSVDTGGSPMNYFVMSFQQNMIRHDNNFSWQVDGSPDLSDWTNSLFAPVLVDRVNHANGTAIFNYRTANPISVYPESFLRLLLTLSNP